MTAAFTEEPFSFKLDKKVLEKVDNALAERTQAVMDTKVIRRILLRNRLICAMCDTMFEPIKYSYHTQREGFHNYTFSTTYDGGDVICRRCVENQRLSSRGLALNPNPIGPRYVLLKPPEPEPLLPHQTRISIQEWVDQNEKNLSGPPTDSE